MVAVNWKLAQKISPPPAVFISDYSSKLAKAINKVMGLEEESTYKKEVLHYLNNEIEIINKGIQIGYK